MSRHQLGRRWIQQVLCVAVASAVGFGLASVSPAAAKKAADKKTKKLPPVGAPLPSLPGVSDEQVTAAIAKAQQYLLSHQNKEGNWEEVQKPEKTTGVTDLKGRQWGGLTSIATYALLASGKDPRSTPELQKAIDFLLHADISSTYALGLCSQIVLYIPQKDAAEFGKRNVALLVNGMNQPTAAQLKSPKGWKGDIGFYTYGIGVPNKPPSEFGKQEPLNPSKIQPISKGAYDRSNSQYGVLGAWALAEAGFEVPTLYWQIEDTAWKNAQLHDGGWDYNHGGEENRGPTPSMTAAGIATLFITQDFTYEQNWGECKGGVKNTNIEAGLRWMDQHIAQALTNNLYTLYGIERIGTASGRKYFGTVDWYKQGAELLVKSQLADGSWGGGHGAIPSTSWGLVFLSRGRAPVIMNKLQYGPTAGFGQVMPKNGMVDLWDERPRDVANLAKWAGHQLETYLNWQVVNLKVSPDELHDAPILYMSGSQPMEFSEEEITKLRQYVEGGGMILGNADCGKAAFSKGFTELGKKLFPKYEFRQTSPNDFIFNEQYKQFRNKPKVMELSNNVRKLMVLIPDADPSRAWQTRSSGTKEEGFGLGVNIFLYAVDKRNLYSKGTTYIVHANPAVPTNGKSIKVARLDLGDNADPEPGAWPRMAAIMHNNQKIDLNVSTVKPDALSGNKVAVLTGTGKLTLGPASRAAIKTFVENGGTLIVDAAGGDAAFADTAENELGQVFPGQQIQLLAPNDAVYNYPTAKLEKVGWRDFALNRVSDRHNPKLRGITFGKRVGVFFSREDITEGLVGEPVDGIYGYDPQTASTLMQGILLYADTGGVIPTTQPAPGAKPAPVAGKPETPEANTK